MYDRNAILLWSLLGLLAVQVSVELVLIGPLVARMTSTSVISYVVAQILHQTVAEIELPPAFNLPGCLPDHVSSDRKSTRLNSSHSGESRMPSSA